MKLLNRSTLFFLLGLLPILIISGFIFYYIISLQIDNNTDESINEQKQQVIRNFNPLQPGISQQKSPGWEDVQVTPIEPNKTIRENYRDTSVYDSIEKEFSPYRIFENSFFKNNQNFRLVITRSMIKTDELAENIALSLGVLLTLILTALILINWFVSRRLWKPFYDTLDQLTHLDLNSGVHPPFSSSSIKEFKLMNDTLNKMTLRLRMDYSNRKEFTENASHEMQTPLAIVRSQVDLLIQSKVLTDSELKLISGIDESVTRLSQLNRALLLLTKIENNQYQHTEKVVPLVVLQKLIAENEDQVSYKNIRVSLDSAVSLTIEINPLLAEILFRNLLQNAIRHNVEDGGIHIRFFEHGLIISNTGLPLKEDINIYGRFTKHTPSKESLGLGLAIVKQICDHHNYEIEHSFDSGLHTFRLRFN